MTENISTSVITSEELVTLAERISKLLTEAVLNNPLIDRALLLVQGDMNALNTALSKDTLGIFTKQINEKDYRRDKTFMGFRSFLEAYSYHLDDNLSKAAEHLLAIFRKHGTRLHREGNAVQTTKMKLLMADLELPENATTLATLQATPWLEMMKKENEEFETLVEERNIKESSKESPLINEKKFALGNRLNKLLDMLELMEDSGEPANIGETVAKINEAINQVMTVARGRKTRNHNSKTKEDEEKQIV
jgi:hypothetical protein